MSLVGRDIELAEIAARVGRGRRLVTIVGPGGIGKTTLARAVLVSLGTVDASGVVELAAVARPDGVSGAFATQLGFPSFEALVAAADRRGLLLVDNCEHVVDAAADAVGLLLERCPELVVVATSRSPLDLAGESLVALAPLALPPEGDVDESCASVHLFVERARDAGVTLDVRDLELAGSVCRQLDGVPLAIELAAARLRSMSLGELASRLHEGIGVLARARHRGTAHHRSVHETIAWSTALLSEPDRAAFGLLGLCPGWFDVDLAMAVAGEEPDNAAAMIDRLVDASLLLVDHVSTPTRYRMLEPVRAVALGSVAERDQRTTGMERLVDHLVAHVLTRIEQSRTRMSTDAAAAAIDRFDQIDLALRHCLAVDDDPVRARVLYSIMWGIVQQARLDEVLSLGQLLHTTWPDMSGPHGADAASVLATAQLFSGDLDGAGTLAREALAHEHSSVFAAVTLRRALGHAARFERDHAEAASWFAAAAAAGYEAGVPTLATASLAYQAQDLCALGRIDEALDVVRQAANAAAELGSPLTELLVRSVEASILSVAGPAHRAEAAALAEANLAASETGNYPVATRANLQTLAECALGTGELRRAAGLADRLVEASTRAGPGDLRRALEIAAAVLAAGGDDDARSLAATATALADTSPMIRGVPLPSPDAGRVLDRAAALRLARTRLCALATDAAPDDHNEEPAVGRLEHAAFVRAGDMWHLTYLGVTAAIAGSKGMVDLAALLAQPGRDIHCMELAGAAVQQADTGAVIDATARRQYEARIRELQAEIDEAEANNDHPRAERAQIEFDTIVEHLTAALGLAGKSRTSGGTAERARSAVTHRIRAALHRIADALPQAGRHLERSVSTGTYCRYEPEQPVEWDVSGSVRPAR